MSMIVNKDAVFDIVIPYTEILNGENLATGVRTYTSDYPEDAMIFRGKFCPLSFGEMSEIREESVVINQYNERPVLLLRIYCPKVLAASCREWNLTDDAGNTLPIHENVIRMMQEHFVLRVLEDWARHVGERDILNGLNADSGNK